MTKQELLDWIESLPEDLPPETWDRMAAIVRRYHPSPEVETTSSEPPTSEEETPDGWDADRWLEERR